MNLIICIITLPYKIIDLKQCDYSKLFLYYVTWYDGLTGAERGEEDRVVETMLSP